MSFDLSFYLRHIGLASAPRDASGLVALQSAQLRAVTFENINPLLGVEPDLDLASIFDKIVLQGRGGYCFELNALLGAALSALGFKATRTLSRVRMGQAQGGPRAHLAWIADVDGRRYLVDAGFGGPGALEPLEIDLEDAQARSNGVYRLRPDPLTGERIVERQSGSDWFALFGFDEAYVSDADIAAANHLCATWPAMPFPGNLMANRFAGTTRLSVFNRMLTQEHETGSSSRELVDAEDLNITLTSALGLRVERADVERIWAKIATPAQQAAKVG